MRYPTSKQPIIFYLTTAVICCFVITSAFIVADPYVRVRDGKFRKDYRSHIINGCNYWYGAYLSYDSLHDGKNRLKKELDFLQQKGINNVRVFFCGEGNGTYAYRISPAVQTKAGVYNEAILKSFDYFLNEIQRRNMTVVVVLSNNWEWSGGFGQYLEWTTGKKSPLPKTKQWDWEKYCQYISAFYSSKPANKLYRKWISTIIKRKNTVNGIRYANDPHIMSWELANEPRPMTAKAKPSFLTWVKETSAFIKQLDPNHLVTIGSEGVIGTGNDTSLFTKIHNIQHIDYTTIHIWPGIWKWYEGDSKYFLNTDARQKTIDYIQQHASISRQINKPLIVEEFGLRRDGHSFSETSSTHGRNEFYHLVRTTGLQEEVGGFNFWGFAGVPKKDTSTWFWKKGEPYSADPPQEEQGLFSVFESDEATWRIMSNGE